MSETKHQFNEQFLKNRLAANKPDTSLTVVDSNRSEIQTTKVYEGITFVINRGHAYKDHKTGPTTNARFGGPPASVENAIIRDAYARFQANKLAKPGKISTLGTGIVFRKIPIRYNAIATGQKKITISDYMVWQGTIKESWENSGVDSNWVRYD